MPRLFRLTATWGRKVSGRVSARRLPMLTGSSIAPSKPDSHPVMATLTTGAAIEPLAPSGRWPAGRVTEVILPRRLRGWRGGS